VSGTIEGIQQEVVLGNKDMVNLKDINTTPGFYKASERARERGNEWVNELEREGGGGGGERGRGREMER
jgi:hypothetical protein